MSPRLRYVQAILRLHRTAGKHAGRLPQPGHNPGIQTSLSVRLAAHLQAHACLEIATLLQQKCPFTGCQSITQIKPTRRERILLENLTATEIHLCVAPSHFLVPLLPARRERETGRGRCLVSYHDFRVKFLMKLP